MDCAVENVSFVIQCPIIFPVDRLVGGALEVLDSILSLTDEKNVAKQNTIEIATELLTCPSSITVAQHAKMLLAVLHPNRTSYNNHKVKFNIVF